MRTRRPAHPPPLPPARDFREVWAQFSGSLTTMGPTEGAREQWRRGRARYAVWVFRVRDPRVLRRLALARGAVSPYIRELPDREAHVTVHVAGFPAARAARDDDVAERDLDALIQRLRGRPPAAPALAVGGLTSFLTCPVLEVEDPGGGLARIRARLSRQVGEVRFAPYLPHVTVGLFFRTESCAPITRAIEPLRRLAPIPLRPDALELVEFDAAREGAPLETRARIPLAR